MKCEYVGKSEEHNYREAYITYDSKEEEKFNKIYEFLSGNGWKLACEDECASVIVYDKDEYDLFYADYKEGKKLINKNFGGSK